MNYLVGLNPRQINVLGDTLFLQPLFDFQEVRLQSNILERIWLVLERWNWVHKAILESFMIESKPDKDWKTTKAIDETKYNEIEKAIEDEKYDIEFTAEEIYFINDLLPTFLNKHSSKQIPETIYKRPGGKTFIELYDIFTRIYINIEQEIKINKVNKVQNFIQKIKGFFTK